MRRGGRGAARGWRARRPSPRSRAVILALAGGVGGSKLARGLAACLAPSDLTVVVNTGDDFRHLGLWVSPDLDTVVYALAGLANRETGWGLAGETWHFMEALGRLGGETWFRLGDRDLATHVERTRRLDAGATLSEVTAALAAALGVAHRVVPMSDQPVATVVHTDEGPLPFQHYFVRRRCAPAVRAVEHAGARSARPSPAFAAALDDPRLRAIVVAPSNPLLSIGPILAVGGVRDAIAGARVPVVAVSPIVGGEAVKGPAAKILRELGHAASAATIATLYAGVADGLVVDERDRALCSTVEAAGLRVCVADTLMTDAQREAGLAQVVLAFAAELAEARGGRASA